MENKNKSNGKKYSGSMEKEEPENPAGIMYISANGNYIVLHYKTGPWVQRRESLAYRKRRLNRKIFCKISRSCIVNMRMVKSFCKQGELLEVKFVNGENKAVTKPFKKRFKSMSSAFPTIAGL